MPGHDRPWPASRLRATRRDRGARRGAAERGRIAELGRAASARQHRCAGARPRPPRHRRAMLARFERGEVSRYLYRPAKGVSRPARRYHRVPLRRGHGPRRIRATVPLGATGSQPMKAFLLSGMGPSRDGCGSHGCRLICDVRGVSSRRSAIIACARRSRPIALGELARAETEASQKRSSGYEPKPRCHRHRAAASTAARGAAFAMRALA